jgi:hypothetical protein
MRFRCEKGHAWTARWDKIFNQRTWCSVCSSTKKKTLKEAQELAMRFNGKCLSAEYHGVRYPMQWECENGHQFEKTFRDISDGDAWCTICSGQVKRTIEEMKEIAKSYGGKCLSDTYISNKHSLLWECSKGHQWLSPPSRVYLQKNWCNECRKLDFDELKEIAKSRGGKCMSEDYLDANTKLLWKCKEGHMWFARPTNVKRGTWCKKCYQEGIKWNK